MFIFIVKILKWRTHSWELRLTCLLLTELSPTQPSVLMIHSIGILCFVDIGQSQQIRSTTRRTTRRTTPTTTTTTTTTTPTTTRTTTKAAIIVASKCVDTIDDCADYGKSLCYGKYRPFMSARCSAYCGFCTTGNLNISFHAMNLLSAGETVEIFCLNLSPCLVTIYLRISFIQVWKPERPVAPLKNISLNGKGIFKKILTKTSS